MTKITTMTAVDLLVILTSVCGLYAVAGVAARAIETYERMKEQRNELVDVAASSVRVCRDLRRGS